MSQPAFSILIPTYNRAEQLAQCLESLSQLELPHGGFEVIVVDDGGKEPIDQLCGRFQDRLDLRLLTRSRGGPAAARNAGSRLAAGEYLAFTDDDCAPRPDWLTRLEERFRAMPGRLIGGRTINAIPDNPYSRASQRIVDLVYEHFNRGPDGPSFFASNNLAMPKEDFFRLGGFDERFDTAEDRDLCDRWLRAGGRMAYAPEAEVRHFRRLHPASFFRQHFGYGRGAFRFHKARARQGGSSWKPDWGFYRRCLRAVREERRKGAALFMFLMWQAANTAGFLFELACPGRRRLGRKPSPEGET